MSYLYSALLSSGSLDIVIEWDYLPHTHSVTLTSIRSHSAELDQNMHYRRPVSVLQHFYSSYDLITLLCEY
jgi:hypothetical protein